MVFSYFGPNNFLLKSKLKKQVDHFVHENGDFAVEIVDAEEAEIDYVRQATQSLPFLAPKKLVIIQAFAKNKQLTENLENIIEQIPDSIDVVFVEVHPDKRTAWYKYLLKSTQSEVFDVLTLSQVAAWVRARAIELQTTINQSDTLFLIERAGTNLDILDKALQKMSIVANPITNETIQQHVEPALQSTVFELLDTTLGGQTTKALQLYDEQRRQKVEAMAIWAMIIWQLHALATVLSAGKFSSADIAKQSSLSPYVISKIRSLTGRITRSRLKELVHIVRTIDVRLKTEILDTDEAIRYVLVVIST